MNQVQTQDPALVAVEMEPKPSQQMLERARRERATVTVLPKSRQHDAPLVGTVCDVDEDCLKVSLEGEIVGHPGLLRTTLCEVELFLSDARCFFCSEVVDFIGQSVAWTMQLARPERMHLLQRRRFMRAKLQPSAHVELYGADYCGPEPARGQLLNVSPDGLACKVPVEVGDALGIDDLLAIGFTLWPDSEPFTVAARVKNKTTAGSSEWMILGLQFQCDEGTRPHLERLGDVLQEQYGYVLGGVL